MVSDNLLSRRRFLSLGVAVGSAATLTACNTPAIASDPMLIVTATLQFDADQQTPSTGLGTTLPELSLGTFPDTLPDIACVLDGVEEGSITVSGPSTQFVMPLAGDVQVVNIDGKSEALMSLPAGTNVALWLGSGQPGVVEAMQVLPLSAASLPAERVPQPDPTGEMALLGTMRLMTRRGWGAAEGPRFSPKGEKGYFDEQSEPNGWLVYPQPLSDWLTTIVTHHTALSFSSGPREIQQYHFAERGFADIAYHFLIDGIGILYEGRPLGIRGSHTAGANTGTIGIALMGNFELMAVTRAQLSALQNLIAYLKGAYTRVTHLAAHNDFQASTLCPGDGLAPWLPTLAGNLGLLTGTGGYVPPPWATENSRLQ